MFQKTQDQEPRGVGGPIRETSNYFRLAGIRQLSLVQYQEFDQYGSAQCLVFVSKIAQSKSYAHELVYFLDLVI